MSIFTAWLSRVPRPPPAQLRLLAPLSGRSNAAVATVLALRRFASARRNVPPPPPPFSPLRRAASTTPHNKAKQTPPHPSQSDAVQPLPQHLPTAAHLNPPQQPPPHPHQHPPQPPPPWPPSDLLPAPPQQARLPATLDHHLNHVSSRWERTKMRLRWALIRSHRPFNTDDIGAMFSWIIWGHILWIILGTTTFISLVVWAMSTFRLEDVFARWVGRIVTRETGLRVVFEQAIVPDWKSGCIVLSKVFVQRRPAQPVGVATGAVPEAICGAESTAAAAAASSSAAAPSAAAAAASSSAAAPSAAAAPSGVVEFDLNCASIAVTLSVRRWLSGRGILETVEARGVRGVIDRRHVLPDPPGYDPMLHRRKPNRGDFDFDVVKIDDLLVTVLQPNNNNNGDSTLPPVPPFQVSLFACELPKLRRQWLLYDFLNCNYLSGSFDNAMFSMHTRQTSAAPNSGKVQRLRIDGVDVRHLNRGVEGMFGWIESGSVDFLADISLPRAEAELSLGEKTRDLFERWGAQIRGIWSNDLQDSHGMVTAVQRNAHAREAMKAVTIDLRVQFNNPRASAPLYSRSLNYLNNAIIHPVVAYINSRDTYIPVHCSVVKRLSDFDGSWTVYDSGLMGALSSEIYNAFADNARDDEARSRRIKKVGFWSLQFMAQLVLLTLGIVA